MSLLIGSQVFSLYRFPSPPEVVKIGATDRGEAHMNEMAVSFCKLHEPSKLLVLPNAWDAGSARIMESIGATAVATTSAGVAWALGYPDGNTLPIEQLTN